MNSNKHGWRLSYRWTPEVSHAPDFSFVEINKTVLNSPACKFDKERKKKRERLT